MLILMLSIFFKRCHKFQIKYVQKSRLFTTESPSRIIHIKAKAEFFYKAQKNPPRKELSLFIVIRDEPILHSTALNRKFLKRHQKSSIYYKAYIKREALFQKGRDSALFEQLNSHYI